MICPYHPDRTLVKIHIKSLFAHTHGMTYYGCPVDDCNFIRSDKYGRKNYKRGNEKQDRGQSAPSDISSNPDRKD
jgi:hypothetical protein